MANWTYFAAAMGAALLSPVSAIAQQAASEEAEDVVLFADNVYEIEAENTVIAEGNVEAIYQGRILRADKVVYNKATDRVRATGNVVIIEADGTQQFSNELDVDSTLSSGYAVGYSARLFNDAKIVANSAIRQKGGVNALDEVVYTACKVCGEDTTPTWSLRARRAVLDQETDMISYQNAVLEVAGIPVIYLPYFSHPDPSAGRRSGFLVPDLGLSSKLGVFYQQPYYWVISDSSDLTVSPLITSKINPLFEFDYRKRFYSGEVEANTSFTYESDFDSDGTRFGDKSLRSHIYAKGLFNIAPEWQWGFGLERQSDDLYDRRYGIDGQQGRRGLYENQPRRLLSQLFVVGQGENYYTDAALLSFQGLRLGDDPGALPTVAPVFFAERFWDTDNYGLLALNASAAGLTRTNGTDSQRASLGADWSMTRVLPAGFVVEPFAEFRGDFYAIDSVQAGQDDVTRAVGSAGVKVSYPLIHPGKNFDILIEPTLMGAYGFSNANNPNIPNEDSLLYEFDEATLFRANGFGSYDRYDGDAKIDAGISTAMRWKGGVEIAAIAGRRWRSRSDPTFDVASNLDGTSSDWVGGVSADFGPILRVNTRVRLDDEGLNLNRIDTRISTSYKRLRATAQYFKVDSRISPTGVPDEGVFMRGELRVAKQYSLIYGRLRDIEDGRDALHEFGIAYEDDCSRFELLYQRNELSDRTLGPSENFSFRFSLKTLGAFGSNEFD